jgi:modification methylase
MDEGSRPGRNRKSTETSSFGTTGRISHDSSAFYSKRLYHGAGKEAHGEAVENDVPLSATDALFCKSSESMDDLPDNSVHLMVTSPPYNVGKDYDQDLSLTEYREFLTRVWSEAYRVLVPGGRACVNVANLGRRPYIPLDCYIIDDVLRLGFLMRGEIIWDKGSSSSPSTAWGSWQSAKNPTLRDTHEYILVFSKQTFGRRKADCQSTITRDEFLQFTKSVWSFRAESARRVGHPAPFPIELPYRLIQLYTFVGDVVLDPFAGAGTTCLAAARCGRRYVGYDTSQEYLDIARRRLADRRGK